MKKNLILSAFIALLFVGLFVSFNYHFTGHASGLAKQLVEKNRPPEECLKLFTIDIFGPPIRERRRTCVYYYAEYSQNLSACTLLEPGDYADECRRNIGL